MEEKDFEKVWQMIVPVLNIVGALAQRVTGDTMVLRHRNPDGGISLSYPNLTWVEWVNQEGAEPHPSCLQVSRDRHCPLCGGHYAKQKELEQSVQQ